MRSGSLFILLVAVALVLCGLFDSTAKFALAETTETHDVDSKVTSFTAEQESALETSRESFQFQAEVNRMMDIIINSLYKHKEVFLRELVSNASDALDKLRFLSLTSDSDILGENRELGIWVNYDEEAKTLTIRDSGVGMTKNDLINNLGTLAKSGTKKFLETMSENADMGLIGQFGVGFYSVYLVADRVRVATKHNDDEQYIWESMAGNEFTIAKDPRGSTLGRGTEITMFLKEDATEFLSQSRLEEIIKKHSEFITFPIYLYKKTVETIEVPVETETTEDEDFIEDESAEKTEDESVEEKKPEMKTETVEHWDYEKMNGNVAIWSREKEDITDEEYQKFFNVIAVEPGEAANWIHFKAEGEVEFKGLLYVPKEAGNLYEEYNTRKVGVRLYVRKVLIQDDFEDLLPRYLNFIRGVVDSDDLPLNVSRETLQQHKLLRIMSKKLVRKALEMLRKMATSSPEVEEGEEPLALNDPEHPYIKFWEQFGKSIKLGVLEDTPNRTKLAKLLRFKTSQSTDKFSSLDEYLEDKPDWQKDIYYIAAESIEAAEKSPFMEVARAKNINVVYMVDPIDEYVVQQLSEYEGYKFQALTKDGLKFGDEDEEVLKKKLKAYRESFKPLTKFIKDTLGNKVSKVSVSQRVAKSPAVIVTSQFGHTANMERIMRAQTLSNPDVLKAMAASKTLEINPRHPIIVELNKRVQEDPTDETAANLASLVFDTALLHSGFMHEDVDAFAERMNKAIAANLNIDSLELVDDLVLEEPEEELVEEPEEIAHDEF